jgi:PHD/YefM family antitoxin component YafN of YafNO toxin-antitoxin module
MTAKTLTQAIRKPKPAIIRERGAPRYVVLDWETYRQWEEMRDDTEDAARLAEARADPKNQRRVPLARVKKLLKLA